MRGLRCDLHEGGQPAAAHQQPLGDGGRPAGRAPDEHGRHGRAGDWRDAAGRGDADRLDVGHLRRRRAGRRALRPPVDARGRRHSGGDRPDLHGGGGRRGQEAEGPGRLHRRRRQRGESHQRGDRRRCCAVGTADGELRGHAGGAPRRGRAPLPGGVQRGHQHQLPVAARGRVRGERRAGHGRTARGRPARPVQDDGEARLGRGRDDHAAGGARLRGLGCDLHEGGRPASVDQQPVGDGDGPGGHLGGRRAGGGRRRRGAGVPGHAEPGGGRDGGGGLCDGERQRARGRRLPGGKRDADVPGRRVVEDGRGDGVRRLARRRRGDADAAAVERLVGAGDGRRGDGDDRELGPAAAGAAGAVRAGGGGARGRARGGAASGAAGAGLPGPVRGPGAAAGHGARHGAGLPAAARRVGRRASGGHGGGTERWPARRPWALRRWGHRGTAEAAR